MEQIFLYEKINGGHCSCYGLEDQFSPEKVVLPELQKRVQLNESFYGIDKNAIEKLKEIIL